MPRVRTEASSTVTWGEWLTFLADDRDSQPRIITQLNDANREFRSKDFIEDEPLVGEIHTVLDTNSAVTQTNAGSTLNATTTYTSRMRLNTTADDELTSTLTTAVNRDW